MSNEKKNPLIGAFRTPVAGAPPSMMILLLPSFLP